MSEYLQQVTRLLRLQSLDQNKSLEFIHHKYGVKPSALVVAILLFVLIVTVISNASGLVVCLGCCCVPAYLTFLALESGDSTALHKYLIYWVTYAIMEVISPVLGLLLTSTLYILLRIGLTVALLHPQSDISQQLFSKYIGPLLSQHQDGIDSAFGKVIYKGNSTLERVIDKGGSFINKGKKIMQEPGIIGK